MRIFKINDENDTHSYKGWLNSDCLIKRALGIYLYCALGSLIIGMVMVAVAIVLSLLLVIFKTV